MGVASGVKALTISRLSTCLSHWMAQGSICTLFYTKNTYLSSFYIHFIILISSSAVSGCLLELGGDIIPFIDPSGCKNRTDGSVCITHIFSLRNLPVSFFKLETKFFT